MREEVGDGEERDANAESDDHIDWPKTIFLEYPDGLAERKVRVDDCGRVGCDSVVGDGLFLLGQEVGF